MRSINADLPSGCFTLSTNIASHKGRFRSPGLLIKLQASCSRSSTELPRGSATCSKCSCGSKYSAACQRAKPTGVRAGTTTWRKRTNSLLARSNCSSRRAVLGFLSRITRESTQLRVFGLLSARSIISSSALSLSSN